MTKLQMEVMKHAQELIKQDERGLERHSWHDDEEELYCRVEDVLCKAAIAQTLSRKPVDAKDLRFCLASSWDVCVLTRGLCHFLNCMASVTFSMMAFRSWHALDEYFSSLEEVEDEDEDDDEEDEDEDEDDDEEDEDEDEDEEDEYDDDDEDDEDEAV